MPSNCACCILLNHSDPGGCQQCKGRRVTRETAENGDIIFKIVFEKVK